LFIFYTTQRQIQESEKKKHCKSNLNMYTHTKIKKPKKSNFDENK
jgi:hypothetical protein